MCFDSFFILSFSLVYCNVRGTHHATIDASSVYSSVTFEFELIRLYTQLHWSCAGRHRQWPTKISTVWLIELRALDLLLASLCLPAVRRSFFFGGGGERFHSCSYLTLTARGWYSLIFFPPSPRFLSFFTFSCKNQLYEKLCPSMGSWFRWSLGPSRVSQTRPSP